MNFLRTAYNLTVKGNQKAIAGFVVTAVAMLGVQVGGVNITEVTVGELIVSVVTGALNAVAVWIKANKN